MSISEINEKKKEVVRVVEELQRLYEESYGKCCHIDINLDYRTIRCMGDGSIPESTLTDISINCTIKV